MKKIQISENLSNLKKIKNIAQLYNIDSLKKEL